MFILSFSISFVFLVVILLFLCVIPLCDSAVAHSHSGKELSPPMTLQKRHLLMSSYITSQFNYCPLVWLIHNIKLNKKINKVHERALRIVYGDHKTKFSELLNIDKSVTIHQRNLQYLLIEIYKVKKGISSTIMNEIFNFLKILSMNLKVVSIYQAETHVRFSLVLNP